MTPPNGMTEPIYVKKRQTSYFQKVEIKKSLLRWFVSQHGQNLFLKNFSSSVLLPHKKIELTTL